MLYLTRIRIAADRRLCSRGALLVICILLFAQTVPRVGRVLRSLATNGHVDYGPVRRAIPEVPNSTPIEMTAKLAPDRFPKQPAQIERGDQRRAVSKLVSDADDSTPLRQLVRCRELPRSRPCGTDGVIVLDA